LSSEQLQLRIGCGLTAESKFDRFIPAMAEGEGNGGGGGMGVADKGVEEEAICVVYDVDDIR
jgi:hypothetical protein